MYRLYKQRAGWGGGSGGGGGGQGAVGGDVSQSPASFPHSLPIQVAVLLHLRSSMVLMNSTAAVNCIHQ